jgi:hypothetical protein
MSNNTALADVREMAARCRAVAKMPADVAPMVARELKSWASENIAAGRGPDGVAWPAKKDGSRALQGAAKALSTRVADTVAMLTLAAPELFHHFGAQGKPVRKILPGNIPARLGDAIRAGAVEVWDKITKGGKR